MNMEESNEGRIPKHRLDDISLPINDKRVKYNTLFQEHFPINLSDAFSTQQTDQKNTKVQKPSSSLSEKKPLQKNKKNQKVAILCWDCSLGDDAQGASIEMTRIASILSERGHKVHVFTKGESQEVSEQQIDGISYHFFPINRQSSELESASLFANEVCEHIKRIESHEGPFNVVHCYDWQTAKVITNLHGRIPKRVLFTPSPQNSSEELPKDEIFQKDLLEQELITMSDRIICFDQEMGQDFQQRFSLSEEKISIIPKEFNWEDYQWIKDQGEIKKKYDLFPLDPLVLFVGEFNNDYGADILVDAIPGLLKDSSNVRFFMVGDGDQMWTIRIKARYLDFEHALRLVGHKEGRDLQELFQAADILVIPNRVAKSSYQILAGWSAKKPVVATYAAGGNLIKDEENGILVYDNPDSIIQGIEKILFDWPKGHEIAEKGWEEIRKNFSREAMIRKIETLYQ